MKTFITKELRIINPSNPEEDCDVLVEYTHYFMAGKNYMSNGDVGYPDESEVEFDRWKMKNNQKTPSWLTTELVEQGFDKFINL